MRMRKNNNINVEYSILPRREKKQTIFDMALQHLRQTAAALYLSADCADTADEQDVHREKIQRE